MKEEFDDNKFKNEIVEEVDEERLKELMDGEMQKFRTLNDILNQKEECAKILEFVYLDKLKSKVIGENMGLSAANVRKKKQRCLEDIKNIMENRLS